MKDLTQTREKGDETPPRSTRVTESVRHARLSFIFIGRVKGLETKGFEFVNPIKSLKYLYMCLVPSWSRPLLDSVRCKRTRHDFPAPPLRFLSLTLP